MIAVFGDETLLRAALDFEAALARAQAAEGAIPSDAAEVIAGACAGACGGGWTWGRVPDVPNFICSLFPPLRGKGLQLRWGRVNAA